MYIKFLLTIIAICSIAFIYYEYKPSYLDEIIPNTLKVQSNKIYTDSRCNSGFYTKLGISKFCRY